MTRRSALVLVALAVAVAAVVVFTSPSTKANGKTASVSSTTTEVNTTEVPADLGEWETHYYRNDEGVLRGYFGPACIPKDAGGDEDAQQCLLDLADRAKHDPELLSAKLRDFKLLDNFFGMTSEEFAQLSVQEVEDLRWEAADRLKDVELRKEWQPKVETIIESIEDPKIVPLEGTYYTEWVDSNGSIHQDQKEMDPDVNIAVVGTLPDGTEYSDKVDCGHQAVSKVPIPGVPEKPAPPTETTTTTQVTTTTTTVVEEGKDDQLSSHDEDSDIPDQERGCTGTGSTPSGTPSDGNDCPSNTGGTADPQCTNTDGSHTPESDGYCDNSRPPPPSTTSSSSTTTTSTSSTTTSTTAPPSDRTGPNESPPTTEDRPRENATTTTQPGQTSPSTTSPPTTQPPPPQ